MQHTPRALPVLALLTMLTASAAQAEIATYFHGYLLESPPCVVNGGEQIVVDFGEEVMTTRVDGQQYRERIDFTLDCSAAISSKQKVRISGSTTTEGFDGTVLSTPKAGLGLALWHDEVRYAPGEWLAFDADETLPVLYAVPVKATGATLSGGSFSVLASLVVDYQ